MASRVPQSPYEVAKRARGVDPSVEVRGFREVQMETYLAAYLETHGVYPSYAIVRDDLDYYDEAGVFRVIERLERKGRVKRVAGRGRGQRCIRLVVNNK